MPEHSLTYCGELVRRHDPDRFLISLVMPPERRAALWALFAFNYEIAKTREVVTETTLGLIRLQWWREAIGEIYDGREPRHNEILPELAAAIKAHNLPRAEFETLIYAREFDLENVSPGSMAGLELYAEQTQAPLVRLALLVLGQAEDADVISRVATGYSLTGVVRATPFYARQGRCYLPADLLAEQEVSREALLRQEPDKKVMPIIQAISIRAGALLAVRPSARFVKAMAVLARIYLKEINGVGGDVFALDPARPPPLLHLRFLFRMAL